MDVAILRAGRPDPSGIKDNCPPPVAVGYIHPSIRATDPFPRFVELQRWCLYVSPVQTDGHFNLINYHLINCQMRHVQIKK